jgi:hypothetical protein
MFHRHDDVVRRFAEACQLGDIATLRSILDADAIAVFDRGGLLPAARSPIYGAEDIAQLAAVLLGERPDIELAVEAVNGRAGLALRRSGRAVAVVAIETSDARIAALWVVLNPAKLSRWHRRGQGSASG